MSSKETTEVSLGQVITFYSYKGGTGRTMALANVACLLAQQQAVNSGRGVLMIDWDLEAPGLHRFFRNYLSPNRIPSVSTDAEVDRQLGLIDLFAEFDEISRRDETNNNDREAVARMMEEFDLGNYVLDTSIPHLSLIKAGRFDAKYASHVNGFHWDSLFQRSPLLIQTFAESLTKRYEYVLIDSRTGLNDISGISTMIMPQKLVIVFTPNRQSVIGVNDLIRQATQFRKRSRDLRPMQVFPLASRIETSEPIMQEYWRYGQSSKFVNLEDRMDFAGYQPMFERLFEEVYELKHCDLGEYFQQVQIQHIAPYAYGENVAVLRQPTGDRLSLTASYKKFAEWLVNQTVPWKQEEVVKPDADQLTEAAFQTLPIEQHETAKRMFTRLIRIADPVAGGDDARQPIRFDELTDPERTVALQLSKAGAINIITDANTNQKLVEAAQEGVARNWERLRSLIQSDRDFLLRRQRLRDRLMAYEKNHSSSDLLAGSDLDAAIDDLAKRPYEVNEREGSYIVRSRDYRWTKDHERANRQNRRKWATLVSIAAAALLVGTLFWWQKSSNTAKSAEVYLNVGRNEFNAGLLEPAIDDLTKATELNPQLGEAFYLLGKAHFRLAEHITDSTRKTEENSKARQALDQAINVNPGSAALYNQRALVRQRLGDLDGAIADLQKTIDLDPRTAEAWLNLGNVLAQKNDYGAAFTAYETALALNRSSEVYIAIGRSRGNLGKWAEAIEAYTEAIRMSPRSAEGYEHRADAYTSIKDSRLALEDYNQAIRIDPKNAKTYFHRGKLFEILKDYQGAGADYEKAIQLNKDFSEAHYNLGGIYLAQGKYETARKEYEIAKRTNPNYQSNFQLGVVYQKLANYAAALEALNEALKFKTASVEAYLQRGFAKKSSGDKSGADADFLQALRLSKDPETRDKTRSQLREGGAIVRIPWNETNVELHVESEDDKGAIDELRVALSSRGFKAQLILNSSNNAGFGQIRVFNPEDKDNAVRITQMVNEFLLTKGFANVRMSVKPLYAFGRSRAIDIGRVEVWIPSLLATRTSE